MRRAAVGLLAGAALLSGVLLSDKIKSSFRQIYGRVESGVQSVVDYAYPNEFADYARQNIDSEFEPDFTQAVDLDGNGRREIIAIATAKEPKDTIISDGKPMATRRQAKIFNRTIFILPYEDNGPVIRLPSYAIENRNSKIYRMETLDLNADGFKEIILFAEWDQRELTLVFRRGAHVSARDVEYGWDSDLGREGRLVPANLDGDEYIELIDFNDKCGDSCTPVVFNWKGYGGSVNSYELSGIGSARKRIAEAANSGRGRGYIESQVDSILAEIPDDYKPLLISSLGAQIHEIESLRMMEEIMQHRLAFASNPVAYFAANALLHAPREAELARQRYERTNNPFLPSRGSDNPYRDRVIVENPNYHEPDVQQIPTVRHDPFTDLAATSFRRLEGAGKLVISRFDPGRR